MEVKSTLSGLGDASFLLAVGSMLYLFIGVVYYGRKKPAYSHLRDTISELGEKGSWYTRRVSAYFFLPLGSLLWALAIAEENGHLAGLAFCLGAGYVVAAFFPCEKGSPIKGNWQQQLHNLGGLIEYAGSAWFLWRLSENGFVHPVIPPLLLACALALSLPVLSPLRGLIQRMLEALLFGLLLLLSLQL